MKTDWKQIYQYVLGGLIVAMFAGIVMMLVKSQLDESVKDPLLVLLGVLAGAFKEVIGYFFGSSKGSSDKNDIMQKKQNE